MNYFEYTLLTYPNVVYYASLVNTFLFVITNTHIITYIKNVTRLKMINIYYSIRFKDQKYAHHFDFASTKIILLNNHIKNLYHTFINTLSYLQIVTAISLPVYNVKHFFI